MCCFVTSWCWFSLSSASFARSAFAQGSIARTLTLSSLAAWPGATVRHSPVNVCPAGFGVSPATAWFKRASDQRICLTACKPSKLSVSLLDLHDRTQASLDAPLFAGQTSSAVFDFRQPSLDTSLAFYLLWMSPLADWQSCNGE